MATIIEDIKTASDWISIALTSSGYKADFSPESFKEIDRFFNEHSKKGKPKFMSLLSKDLGKKIFAIGSYVGEVIRKKIGGEWSGDDNDPEVEMKAELQLPDGTICWPVMRVMKRFKNGMEDSIMAYGISFGVGQNKE